MSNSRSDGTEGGLNIPYISGVGPEGSEVYLKHLTSVEKTDKLLTTIMPKFKSTKHNILYSTSDVNFRNLQSCNIYTS